MIESHPSIKYLSDFCDEYLEKCEWKYYEALSFYCTKLTEIMIKTKVPDEYLEMLLNQIKDIVKREIKPT